MSEIYLSFESDLTDYFLATLPALETAAVERSVLRHIQTYRDTDAAFGPVLAGIGRTMVSIIPYRTGLSLRMWWREDFPACRVLNLQFRDDEDDWLA